ncbi:D-alanyl-D-alanine carboxypeptidase (penicillin-binding protein 5/6) [Labedaea rhizosphaerae]|uniref:D-alanyl-D-alanine carboxypeptidase (Penicillin-binding protein 5/6) n=2 Tax=Labedaea rhizosphaerae TaxID=598644 RepID=A0A4R6SPP3_LABRH|nr:D-alanyl-D-alanine carboxypeptidase (penicillin-binding protein 5/6) [Labedaea rhizosphaerae]
MVTGMAPIASAQPGCGGGDGAKPPVGGPRMAECGVVLPANADLPPDGLDAASWLLADQDSGQVLAANAPHVHRPPASIAKVLLAMVALRDLNPDTVVTATREDTAQQGSRIGLVADGRYTVRDLTVALIVSPAADAANALARQLGGEGEALKRVNNLAQSMGALDTNIKDPTGLDADGMTTSAYDTALIYRQAMRNQNFAAATGAPSVQLSPVGRGGAKIVRSNDNELLGTYDGATGGKAGFTDAAKNIYVGSAARGGRRIVVALLGASSAFDQATKLLDYGFKLTAAHTAPVGDLNNKAGAGVVTPQPPADGPASNTPDNDPAAAQRVAMDRSMFGNVGGFVVAAGGLAVLLMFVLALKRKADRAAAMRRRRAQARASNYPVH